MSGAREKKRMFSIEPSGHANGHWRLLVGSHRFMKPPSVFILTDQEVDDLGNLLAATPTTNRTLEALDA